MRRWRRKNLLCRMGFHKPDYSRWLLVRKRSGRHKWHTNYFACKRCGKYLYSFGFKKGDPNGK